MRGDVPKEQRGNAYLYKNSPASEETGEENCYFAKFVISAA